jgi:hypothetical protein
MKDAITDDAIALEHYVALNTVSYHRCIKYLLVLKVLV